MPTEGKYHPAPSIGHELGVMFGFMAFFLIAITVYLLLWKSGNRRSEARETARREALAQRGFGGEKSRLDHDDVGPNHNSRGGAMDGGEGELVSN